MSAHIFLKYIGWQLVIALVLVALGFGIGNSNGALSATLGCAIAILPNAYFTLQAFRYKASEDPVRALGALYRGEAGKIILVMVFCALSFRFFELNYPLLLFVSLIVMLVTQTLASVCIFPALKAGEKAPSNKNETD